MTCSVRDCDGVILADTENWPAPLCPTHAPRIESGPCAWCAYPLDEHPWVTYATGCYRACPSSRTPYEYPGYSLVRDT